MSRNIVPEAPAVSLQNIEQKLPFDEITTRASLEQRGDQRALGQGVVYSGEWGLKVELFWEATRVRVQTHRGFDLSFS